MTDWGSTKLRDFFAHYDPSNPEHCKAVDTLQKDAAKSMNDDAEWVRIFRTAAKADTSAQVNPADVAAKIITEFEGFRGSPYICPAGVMTIGYGTTYYPNGELVGSGDATISKEKALELLIYHINHALIPALEKIPTWGKMNPYQKAAVISFGYNLGSHFYGGDNFNTITRALSSTVNWPNVPSALMLYVNPGSSFEAGLRRRREAEGNLWKTPI